LAILPLLALSGPAPAKTTSVQNKYEDWVKPWFCKNDIDCPVFTVVSQNREYEIRTYKQAKWVTTTNRDGFGTLFDYISGENEGGVKVDMTAPVKSKVDPRSWQKSTMTTSFYIPEKYQQDEAPPRPTRPDVYLETLPEVTVYVRSFSGYASTEDYTRQATMLAEAIGDSSLYIQDYYFKNGYDSPFQPFNRHNEVWFVARR